MKSPTFFAMNRKTNSAAVILGFEHWEQVQWAFRVGILLPDGTSADAIGRCRSFKEFVRKANHGGTKILDGKTTQPA